MSVVVPAATLVAGLAVALAFPRASPPGLGPPPGTASPDTAPPGAGDWMQRWRPALAALAGAAAGTFLGGLVGVVAAVGAGVTVWVVIGRAEPVGRRREREQAAAELPHIVRLLGAALSAGAAPADALEIVAAALPGPAADRLAPVAVRLRLGADPASTWAMLAADQALGELGRALGRAHDSGASVVVAVSRLADDLAGAARAAVEDRARAVGVKAAAPLGLCLLPAFLLIGVVPLVGGLITSLRL